MRNHARELSIIVPRWPSGFFQRRTKAGKQGPPVFCSVSPGCNERRRRTLRASVVFSRSMLFMRQTPIALSTRARRELGLLPRPAKRGEGWGEGLLCAVAPHPSDRVAAPFSPLPAQSGERAPAATPRFHFAASLAPQSSFAPEALMIAVHLGISDLI